MNCFVLCARCLFILFNILHALSMSREELLHCSSLVPHLMNTEEIQQFISYRENVCNMQQQRIRSIVMYNAAFYV